MLLGVHWMDTTLSVDELYCMCQSILKSYSSPAVQCHYPQQHLAHKAIKVFERCRVRIINTLFKLVLCIFSSLYLRIFIIFLFSNWYNIISRSQNKRRTILSCFNFVPRQCALCSLKGGTVILSLS